MVSCNSCGDNFDGFKELALHITTKKDKAHRKGRRWAANFLSKTKYLNSKKDLPGRTKLSEEDKQNKIDTHRELSGQNQICDTICPRCLTKGRAALEVEHAQEVNAWKIKGRFAVYCSSCRE